MGFKKTVLGTVLAICAAVTLQPAPSLASQDIGCSNYWAKQQGLSGAAFGGIIGAAANSSPGGLVGGLLIGGLIGSLTGASRDSAECRYTSAESVYADYHQKMLAMARACLNSGQPQYCSGRINQHIDVRLYSLEDSANNCTCFYLHAQDLSTGNNNIIPVCGNFNQRRVFVVNANVTNSKGAITIEQLQEMLARARREAADRQFNATIAARDAALNRYNSYQRSSSISAAGRADSGHTSLSAVDEQVVIDRLAIMRRSYEENSRFDSRNSGSNRIVNIEFNGITKSCTLTANDLKSPYLYVDAGTCRSFSSLESEKAAQTQCINATQNASLTYPQRCVSGVTLKTQDIPAGADSPAATVR